MKAKDNNISLNENIILRTDSEEEDLNNKIESFQIITLLTLFFALEESDSVAALKYGLKRGVKFRRSFLSLVLPVEYLLLGDFSSLTTVNGVEMEKWQLDYLLTD
jgi:hypothetical protein